MAKGRYMALSSSDFAAFRQQPAGQPAPAPRPVARTGGSARSTIWFAQDETRGALIDWLRANTGRSNFLRDVCVGFDSYGTLSPNQEAAVRRAMASTASAGPATPAPTTTANLGSIVDMMRRASTTLKNPKVLCAADEQQFRLTVAGEGARAPGTVNVCSADRAFEDRSWFGRILADGRFEPARNADPATTARVGRALTCLAADPEAAAKAYGQRFGACCFCARELTDKASIEAGYGPICAEKYGLAHG